jgi:hypothetical protein
MGQNARQGHCKVASLCRSGINGNALIQKPSVYLPVWQAGRFSL